MKKLNVVMMILLALSIAMPATLSFSKVKPLADQSLVQVDKVNINTADEQSLATIPGIGPQKAQRIIAYRQENGKFNKIEELTSVKGIGEKSLKKIRDYLAL